MQKYRKYRELFEGLVCYQPSMEIIRKHYEEEGSELQDFCSLNCTVSWNTGIGIIEAVEQMYIVAVENGNIKEGEVT